LLLSLLGGAAAHAEVADFRQAVAVALANAATTTSAPQPTVRNLDDVCRLDDPIEGRVFREYGAVFIAGQGSVLPSRCAYSSPNEVAQFQATLALETKRVGGVRLTLQAPAMADLLAAVAEAKAERMRITPADRRTAGLRTFAETSKLWRIRVKSALRHWVRRGRLARSEAKAVLGLPMREQALQVLAWEEAGLWFAPGYRKSIVYAVAIPGTSQHVAALALDVREYDSEKVRAILARHGWFQTVRSDAPHFTYLGRAEEALTDLGLQQLVLEDRSYWVPRLEANETAAR
jgi:hypothetical protein